MQYDIVLLHRLIDIELILSNFFTKYNSDIDIFLHRPLITTC